MRCQQKGYSSKRYAPDLAIVPPYFQKLTLLGLAWAGSPSGSFCAQPQIPGYSQGAAEFMPVLLAHSQERGQRQVPSPRHPAQGLPVPGSSIYMLLVTFDILTPITSQNPNLNERGKKKSSFGDEFPPGWLSDWHR